MRRHKPEDETRHASSFRLYLRLLAFTRPYRGWAVLIALLLVVGVFYNLFHVWIQQHMVEAINGGDLGRLHRFLLLSGIVFAVFFLFASLERMMIFHYDQNVRIGMMEILFCKINTLSLGHIRGKHTSDWMTRLKRDVSLCANTTGTITRSFISQLVLLIMAFVYLASLDIRHSAWLLALAPLPFLAGRLFDKRIRTLSRETSRRSGRVRGAFQEMLHGLPDIKINGMEAMSVRRIDENIRELADISMRRTLAAAFATQTVRLLSELIRLGVYVLAVWLAIYHDLTVGTVLALTLLMSRIQAPFNSSSRLMGTIQGGFASAERVFGVLDLEGEGRSGKAIGAHTIEDTAGRQAPEGRTASLSGSSGGQSAGAGHAGDAGEVGEAGVAWDVGDADEAGDAGSSMSSGGASQPGLAADAPDFAVSIRNLHFSYSEEGRERPLFRNFNLDLQRGEIVAVIGPSGSGKSTLARLCCGLYDFTEGDILVNGKSLGSGGVRPDMAYVPQEPFFFTGTIYDNIILDSAASPEEVREAARKANILEDIQKLPRGFEEPIKELGNNLSGGQKQKIALARVFLQQANLYILDEATSALDVQSELIVHESIERLMEGKTALIITHRLTALRMATRIVVLDNGNIADQGTYAELKARQVI